MPVTHKQTKVDPTRFAMVPRNDVPRSAFDVQHMHKTTFLAGSLVPIYVDEVLPGDSFRVRMTAFARTAVPVVPIMDNLWLESFFFFVPNRLVWDNWERFMGEQASPTDTTEFLQPYITLDSDDDLQTALLPHTLADWFGITLNGVAGQTVQVNALPFRAYALIWNDWFRDQDIDPPQAFPTDDGPDTYAADYNTAAYVFKLGLIRRKRHDYFTSCRPWPQKPINAAAFSQTSFGGPFVPGGNMTLPQSGAPVSGLGVVSGAVATVATNDVKQTGARTQSFGPSLWYSADDPFYMKTSPSGVFPDVRVLINDIRTANQVQLLMERYARGGTRYAEIVRSIWGIVSPDARLQRPEYLGGGRTAITVNPVAQTSESGTTVLGELAGIGTAILQHGFSSSFTEHGIIIGLVNVRADLTYQQGIERLWFRRTQFDHYTPPLAHLGEQAVLSKEIFANGTTADDDAVFGYQERWAEYKYRSSRVSGVFRSTFATPIDMWHLAFNFAGRPSLNGDFIEDTPPLDRVLQVETAGSAGILMDALFHTRLVRCMPMFSIPGMGPHL